MAQKTSVLEDLMEVTAKLPWWIGVVLAVVSYLILHAIAGRELPPTKLTGDAISAGLMKGLASVGQYILPIAFGGGALISAIQRHKRRGLVQQVRSSTSANPLAEMSWQEFEGLVAEAFRLRGFSVQETGGGGPDGGMDLVLKKGSDKYLVQCKQWRAFKVGVVPVRELYGVMAATGAAGGYMVTAGTFTEEARTFASGRHLQLVDGETLVRLLDEVRSGPDVAAPKVQAASAPSCPSCGYSMVRRTARKGSNAGSDFWGCGMYPKCRGTRPIST